MERARTFCRACSNGSVGRVEGPRCLKIESRPGSLRLELGLFGGKTTWREKEEDCSLTYICTYDRDGWSTERKGGVGCKIKSG